MTEDSIIETRDDRYIRWTLASLVRAFGLERVQTMLSSMAPSKLKSTGDAHRDRLVRERLGLRV